MRFRPFQDGGLFRRPTKSDLGEEATPCLCLLAAGQGPRRGDRRMHDGLSPAGTLVPLETRAGNFEVFFLWRVCCVWLPSLALRAGRVGGERQAESSDMCW